jgi:glycosyltransferase involved in cell wall biosynthesis
MCPGLYGGTKRLGSALTEELVRRGDEVTIFASGDSPRAAPLVPIAARSVRLDATVVDPRASDIEVGGALEGGADFDIIHSHLHCYELPLSRFVRTPVVTTQHVRLDLPDLPPIYRHYHEAPQVSINDSQRAPLPAHGVATVYNGIDLAPFRHDETRMACQEGEYVAFLGRISPEKKVEGGDHDRATHRRSPTDRGEDRPYRSGLLLGADQAADRRSP